MGSRSVVHGSSGNWKILCENNRATPFVSVSALPLAQTRLRVYHGVVRGKSITGSLHGNRESSLRGRGHNKGVMLKNVEVSIPRSSGSSDSNETADDTSSQEKTPFGYSRKDVLLIGVGVTLLGIGLKSGLELVGVDPLQAGNVVQLVLVLGLTVGWISTYIFRVSNKEMTYAQQLRDYEKKVMEKRLESLSEAELQVLLEQVEEEKRSLGRSEQVQ